MRKLHHFVSKLTEYLDKLLKAVYFLQSFHSCKNLQNREYFIIGCRCERLRCRGGVGRRKKRKFLFEGKVEEEGSEKESASRAQRSSGRFKGQNSRG